MALRLNPNIFYVPVAHGRAYGPYGRAYGYYWHRGPRYLTDPDIVNLVNLRFISSYYHVPPREIMERRARGEDFASIRRYYAEHEGRHRGDDGREGHDHGHRDWHGRDGREHDHGHWDHGHGRGDDD